MTIERPTTTTRFAGSAASRRGVRPGYSNCIGGVGALAVALGVTGAVIATPGTAWADEQPSVSSSGTPASNGTSSDTSDSPPAGADAKSGAAATSESSGSTASSADSAATTSAVESESRPPGAPSESQTVTTFDSGVIVRSSGGAHMSHDSESDVDLPSDEDAADAETELEAQVEPAEATALEPVEHAPVGGPTVDAAAPTSDLAVQPTSAPTDATSHGTAPEAGDPATVGIDPSQAPVVTTIPTTIDVAVDDEQSQAAEDSAHTVLRSAADAAPVAATTAAGSQVPSPAQVLNQIADTLTTTFTKCACSLITGVQNLIASFSSVITPAPSTPTDPAQAPLLWTIAAWVRRQVDYAVAAFNRSPIGQVLHQVSTQISDFVLDIGNSPLGRQFSSDVGQFLAECEDSVGLPAEFDRTTVVSGLSEPTDFAILTDELDTEEIHRIFITEKSGALKTFDPHTGQLSTLASLPVVTAEGERGLIGIEIDPHFWDANQLGYHTVYVAYTGADNYDRLSSLLLDDTLDGVIAAADGRPDTVLVKSDQLSNEFHHAGELAFDPNGEYLYWALGNNTINENSQDLSTLHGKILRLNRDGTAPTDNPFFDDPDAEPRIYAYGLRNPFRFTFTPDGELLAGDVGEATWEELNLVTAGANYGWPDAEGSCTGCGYVNPIYAYRHSLTAANAGSITAVAVYTGNTYPDEYQNTVFIADYSLGWIKALTFDDQYTSLIGERTFDSGAGAVVKLAMGPDDNLYQLNIYPGTLSVIAPSGGNRAPSAVIDASATSGGGSSLTVQFDADDSSDPDGDALTYLWNFGDGRTSTELNPTVVFTNTSVAWTDFNVTLTVSDGAKLGQTTQRIVVGSTSPTVDFSVSQSTYDAGDTVTFTGDAFDVDDAVLPAGAYNWTVEFHHADHMHPFQSAVTGPVNTITIPRNADQLSNTFYRVILTVTDSSGLTTTAVRDVMPNTVTLSFGASDGDATYTIDGIPHKGLYTETAVVGVERTLNAPSPQNVGGRELVFGGWSDGGAQAHVIVTPGTATSYQATFTEVSTAATVLT